MKKGIALALIFLMTFFIGIVILSYVFGNGIKLDTSELPFPNLTYFAENIKHNLGFKFCISFVISIIFTTAIGFIYSYKKRGYK